MQKASAAYAPLSVRVFGSSLISIPHRLAFLRSLILSRLLFNIQTSVPKARDMQALDAVYMKVLRRICGQMRFPCDVELTDLKVRVELQQPSLDCIIAGITARARLQYLGRVVRQRHRGLPGLLHMRRNGKRLPWVVKVASDVEHLRRTEAVGLQMGPSLDSPESWYDMIMDKSCWRRVVASLFFIESVRDSSPKEVTVGGAHLGFACRKFDSSFSSQRALESHCRAKHGERLRISEFIDSSKCPCCGTTGRDYVV